jgi:DNA repair exonuclease SbcCD ATPase subunit
LLPQGEFDAFLLAEKSERGALLEKITGTEIYGRISTIIFSGTLFIDEGFGALDADTLDIAITALETLHGQGRKVGVITHVAAMIESIPVQVKVEKLGGGSSIVRMESVASTI